MSDDSSHCHDSSASDAPPLRDAASLRNRAAASDTASPCDTAAAGGKSLWESPRVGARLARAVVLVLGIALGQAVLYGPSLVGQKILLPLDILQAQGYYLPQTPELRDYRPRNRVFADEVVAIEMRRRFAAREVRQGRLPLWNPYNYCGAPFIAANNTAVFSPFRVPDYFFPGPRTIAWVQMYKSLVAGVGAYLFFRVALGVGFWPAAIGAWCFPLIGFLVWWRGYPPSFVVVWLPWLLLAVECALRRPAAWGAPLLALITAATMLSGHMALAAHVLLVSGLYAVWRWFHLYASPAIRRRTPPAPIALAAAVAVVGGWTLGFALSALQTLPTLEYLRISYRVAERRVGQSLEIQLLQPGLGVLPQFVLPDLFGSLDRDSWWIAPGGVWRDGVYYSAGNPLEGAPAGYAGLLMTLVFAPLGLYRSDNRRAWWFWLVTGLFAASYLLKIPLIDTVFELPPLNVLKNNRFTFATAWASITMAVLGLDALRRGEVRPTPWCLVPVALIAVLAAYCGLRSVSLPVAITSGLPVSAPDPQAIAAWFRAMYRVSLFICLLGLALWALLAAGRLRGGATWTVLPLLLVGELLWQQFGRNPQCDPKLYYPPIASLEQLQQAPPGRICGWRCLPACLNQSHWLPDVRGYDGADPVHIVRLLLLADPHRKSPQIPYALTQLLIPFPSPVLDMLNLRYRIHRGSPGPNDRPRFQSRDYWVEESDTCLPRAYVPRHITVEPQPARQLVRVAADDFDPREVAYVDQPLETPLNDARPIVGKAKIVGDLPCEVTIDVDMETPGVLVLADMWFPGWHVSVDGQPRPLLRTNHAIRGVEVPAGRHTVVFRYQPESFARGLRLTGFGGVVLLLWCGSVLIAARRSAATPTSAQNT